MILSTNVCLKGLAVHRLGEEGLQLSTRLVSIDDELLSEVLVKYFFQSFKGDARYHFEAPDQNLVCQMVGDIFNQPENLHQSSIHLAQHLFAGSEHHNIKAGDLFVVYFEDCVLDDEVVEVVGLFKAERKDTFLKIYSQGEVFGVEPEEGISINKIDKGALIFNTGSEDGFVVETVDNINKKEGAQYWNDNFLNIIPIKNEFFETRELVHLCQDFISEAVPEDDKTGKIALFNESMNFLKKNEHFSHQQYMDEVLQQPDLIDSYEAFRQEQSDENEVLQKDEVVLSKPAIKQSKKWIRSVIKLDKNFHIYVHGNREKIEKGYDDERHQKYYKLYFDEES